MTGIFSYYALVALVAAALTVAVLLVAAGLIDSPDGGPCSPPLHRGVVQYDRAASGQLVPLYGCVR